MSVSIITSLYRSAIHINKYIGYLIKYQAQLAQVDIALEVIIIANDSTVEEKNTRRPTKK